VTVNFSATTLSPGQSTQATAIARDANGNVLTGRSVSWSSLNPSIATVSTFGVVTAVSAGSATIRATVETKIGDGVLTVSSGTVAVATVGVTLVSTSLNPGQTTQASAVARDASGNVLTGRVVAWSSLNTSIATVSPSGLVTAVAAGSATIRATVETKTGDAGLTVAASTSASTAAVVATVDSSTLAPGHTSQGHAVAKDALGNVLTGKTASWVSNNSAIATVSATTGVVTAVSAGSAVLQATIDGVAGQASVNVTVPSIITAPAPSSGTLVSHDFEDGTLGPFYNPWGTGMDVISDPTGGGHGRVARLHYSGPGNSDSNLALLPKTNFAHALGDSVWFRGDFYLPSVSEGDQRKLLYWGWSKDSWGFQKPFDMVLTSFGSQFVVRNLPDPSWTGSGGLDYIPLTTATLTAGVWHTLKVQLKVNTSFAATDGVLRIWYDGRLIYEHTNMRWTDPTWTDDPKTYQWVSWQVGQQTDSFTTAAFDEYRYWDNVTFTKTAILP
jgi:uncharacterized protein YjdB